MQAYIRRGLPTAVRRELELEINRMTNNTEKELINKMIEILPHLAERLIDAYRGKRPPDDGALAPVSSQDALANNTQFREDEDPPCDPEPPYYEQDPPYDEQGLFKDLVFSLDFVDPSLLYVGSGAASTISPTS